MNSLWAIVFPLKDLSLGRLKTTVIVVKGELFLLLVEKH